MKNLIFLAGPTAIGKTELSLDLAEKFGCEIISMDSMQIYKYMDIGSAKPGCEERKRVPHHLIGYVDPAEEYNVSRFVRDAENAIKDIGGRGRLPLLVGGTGLYMKGLLEGIFEMVPVPEEIRKDVRETLKDKGLQYLYEELKNRDPDSATRLHPNDRQRILRALEIHLTTGVPWSVHLERQKLMKEIRGNRYRFLKIGLNRDREELYRRINRRVEIMVESGLLKEVEDLLGRGYSPELSSMRSLGYRHMVKFIHSEWTWDEALHLLARDTRRYAKRQITWFRNDHDIHWFEPAEMNTISEIIHRFVGETDWTQ